MNKILFVSVVTLLFVLQVSVAKADLWVASGNNIYNNNTGNVGIGTTSPLSLLDITGPNTVNTPILTINQRFNGVAGEWGINFTRTYDTNGNDQTAGYIKIKRDGGDSNQYMVFGYGDRDGVSDRMVIADSGSVGIGTTSPGSFKLSVNGVINTANYYNLNDGTGYGVLARYKDVAGSGTDNSITVHSENSFYVTTGGGVTKRLVIDTSGSVGIGTTNPGLYKLQVAGNVSVNSGTNIVYRCTTGGTLPGGALTINVSTCGAVADTGLRVS